MDRCVCIHGHFYQPPRENPWLEDIELQDSAYPYHDWNERITAECYTPNSASRILDTKGRIKDIINNYAKISFDFGPTLLDWLETREPEVYRAVIVADRKSKRNFSGHGSAMAQAYGHLIMPLANRRDKITQVVWGVKDFQFRFNRPPEGMWLPETAVDLETLDIMAEQGIRFTVLAPYQARRTRKIGEAAWTELRPEGINTGMPFQVRLPNADRTISVFFYDPFISSAVAFEKLLGNGEYFARRLLKDLDERGRKPRLVNIATDGETYGHHHRHGDMALAYALNYIETNKLARLVNYAEYLAKYPPVYEVEITENTSWSCVHGVERWRANCGCNSGVHPGWSQAWRTPLRDALNWLRNTLAPAYENMAGEFLEDPWAARDDYIEVILDRSPDNVDRFLQRYSVRTLDPAEEVTALKLLELQRHAMLMFTSCGWFFDDISGIETVQVIRYAGRAIQLAEELFGSELEPQFLEMLAQAKSNVPAYRDGANIYEKRVRPSIVRLPKVGAHYAISSLFESYGDRSRVYCYLVDREDHHDLKAGNIKLTVGRVKITSEITREVAELSYGALYFGYHNVHCGVRVYRENDEETYREMVEAVSGAFERAELPEVIRVMDHYFEGMTYSLKQLFRDKLRAILEIILNSTLAEVEANYRQTYERHVSLMRFLKDLGTPQPKALHTAAEFVLNTGLRRAFANQPLNLEPIKTLLDEARLWAVPLDRAGLSYALKKNLQRMAEALRRKPADLSLLLALEEATGLAAALPFETDLWKVQNIYYELLQTVCASFKKKAGQGDEEAQDWLDHFTSLGENLRVGKRV
jgi:alpha-amylase/alpha-mannosidase (GH57 family)